mmetsp:Transcript_3885/g.7435  ORF Transcript_3885/g.7435 Transcript_3885/m.7435 type:complete len:400 (-) Transcript_3885:567-1766(-)|eukprot:CAMPEP_0184678842 /NCGR_PEP_ID=MMETSP0312-20130426/1656_1 /TAXON_ID=31354 /ORGANISM="Compsopogon coeruleus, Strain SAG 36.94" /LENGTH=399 /DNA_ID=CAMNT_0027127899 /DNA_START=75 /DNA_END=1274 /DNA_ORIENTATION=+
MGIQVAWLLWVCWVGLGKGSAFGVGSVGRVLVLREELLGKLSEWKKLEEDLVQQRADLDDARRRKSTATAKRREVVTQRNERELILRELEKRSEKAVERIRSSRKEIARLEESIRGLREERERLKKREGVLNDMLRKSGLRRWFSLEGHNVLSKTAVGVLIRSADLMDPIASKLQGAAQRERAIIDRIGIRSPYVRGVLFLLFVLVPVVGVLAVLTIVSGYLSSLTVLHALTGLCAFFATQSFLLFFLSVLLRSEVTSLLQWNREKMFLGLLLVWAVLFLVFLYLFAHQLSSSPDLNAAFQFIASIFVGYHFYVEVFRPAFLTEEVHITAIAYLTYCTVFVLIGADKGKLIGLDYRGLMQRTSSLPLTDKKSSKLSKKSTKKSTAQSRSANRMRRSARG